MLGHAIDSTAGHSFARKQISHPQSREKFAPTVGGELPVRVIAAEESALLWRNKKGSAPDCTGRSRSFQPIWSFSLSPLGSMLNA